MNKKNIERHLSKKFHEFLQSITDEDLREDVRLNSMVCGGAIASLLLGEKVNDYDIYFTNKNTVRKVAEYYVKKYMEQAPEGFNASGTITVEETEKGRITIKVKSSGVSTHNDNTDKNYEYFESTEGSEAEDYLDAITNLDETPSEAMDKAIEIEEQFRPLMLTQNAITLSDEFQLIIRFYGSPKEIHDNFDYEHVKMHYNVTTSTLHTRKSSLESLLAKELIYTGSKYPVCSLFRMRKYINRGWFINAGQIFKMAFQTSELNLTDPVVLEDQLVGVDTAYFSELIETIKSDGKKDKPIDATYIMSLVDKIF